MKTYIIYLHRAQSHRKIGKYLACMTSEYLGVLTGKEARQWVGSNLKGTDLEVSHTPKIIDRARFYFVVKRVS